MIADIVTDPTTTHLKLHCASSDMKGHHVSEALELNVGLILRLSCRINKLRLSAFAKVWERIRPERTLKASDTRDFRKREICKGSGAFTAFRPPVDRPLFTLTATRVYAVMFGELRLRPSTCRLHAVHEPLATSVDLRLPGRRT